MSEVTPGDVAGRDGITGPVTPRAFSTGWARTPPLRAVRNVVQVAGLIPLIRSQVVLETHGEEHVEALVGPALFVANHSSHLDTAVLLSTLPAERRRRTAFTASADYFSANLIRAAGAALVFNILPIDRQGGSSTLATPGELLAAGWSLVIYPEGTRSADGFMGRFRMGAAWLAAEHQVPVVPVGLRGTYAAMPRGRSWPIPGRPRVSVRYGRPIHPMPGDRPRHLAPRITAAVRALVEEDATTWWRSLRADRPAAPVPSSTWRRIWHQTGALDDRTRRVRIWRG